MKVRTGKYSAAPGADGIGRGRPCLITDHNVRSQEGEDSLGMILSNGFWKSAAYWRLPECAVG